MAEITKLIGEQVDEIKLIESGLKYKDGTKKNAANKTYSRFSFDGIVFTVDDTDPFIECFKAGRVASVKLENTTVEKQVIDDQNVETTVTVKGFKFDTHLSMDQQFNRALHQSKMNMLNATASSKDLTPDSISALMSLS